MTDSEKKGKQMFTQKTFVLGVIILMFALITSACAGVPTGNHIIVVPPGTTMDGAPLAAGTYNVSSDGKGGVTLTSFVPMNVVTGTVTIPSPPPQGTPPAQKARIETGQDKTVNFDAGASAYGWKIVLLDGRSCDGGNCLVLNSPVGGSVTSGVINPWPAEISGKQESFSGAQSPTVTSNGSGADYNLPPQPQVGHPSEYIETGKPDKFSVNAHTKHWVLPLLTGTTAIIGGFVVDGTEGGVYKAVSGPGQLDTTVTDGFVAITKSDWGNAEFCFRIAQAIEFGWAHATEQPLAGWNACK